MTCRRRARVVVHWPLSDDVVDFCQAFTAFISAPRPLGYLNTAVRTHTHTHTHIRTVLLPASPPCLLYSASASSPPPRIFHAFLTSTIP